MNTVKHYYQRHTNNLNDWVQLQHGIFPCGIPESCQWNSLPEIISVLNHIGKAKAPNHTFLPCEGGLDLEWAKVSHEKGCIELHFDLGLLIVKPESLTFQSFKDPLWDYFFLQTQELLPTGAKEAVEFDFEFIVELSPLEYIHNWDDAIELPKGARYVQRSLKGNCAIFSKSSAYSLNRYNGDTYDGRHNGYNPQGFSEYIKTWKSVYYF